MSPDNSLLSIDLRSFPLRLARRSGDYPEFEFHLLRAVREIYRFDESLYSATGNVVFANFRAVRAFAGKMNARRDLAHHPERAIRPGHLNAMGLIDEIYHYVLRLYEETANPGVFARAAGHLTRELGDRDTRLLVRTFAALFPPLAVYRGEAALEEYLRGSTRGKPNSEMILEEMILLYFSNFNPGFAPFVELFDDSGLREHTAYARAIDALETFFRGEKRFGPDDQHIFDLLRAPVLASPRSLEGQLAFIRRRWGMILADAFLQRMLSAGDLIREDDRQVHPGGEAPTVVPTYGPHERGAAGDGADNPDYERFTTDLEWMPKVVILAKNTYVWLDQLSKACGRSISKLNEIPDEELDRLAGWNFTGLWLIGIWERSRASQRIKQLTGNPEAVASAYSLYDYEIASDLGGEEAFQNLRRRAWQRGIRLAGDMVPNHVGLYSKWVVEKPDYFIQLPYPPFPGYRFSGQNLSDDPRVEIRIEDGYWSRADAAVVFQRVEGGNVRYIYHGNDGTSMPWNDTAQLDFLRADVREAVIQAIFHVARKFSVIRFDAAMVLAKKHFRRLWYPEPGSGGAIPSRSDAAMPREEFERLFPAEFWREVVDRINAEMPNTLLLAEAFWLLEGYFVRTLGMHRVYNSAFMHMLMREENEKYRELIRNTLHYNPEILKRYVNFMSNPDEQTAIEQFGTGDKYFGIAVLMVTLPGLPMFAHGQIEGLREKYGMEYRRAYYDESPDRELVARHEREIFPLMQKRHLFSQVKDFELYDFVDLQGRINHNVFVFSNMSHGERALICFHNKFEETAGWVRTSIGKTMSATDDPNPVIAYKTVGEALALGAETYCIFRDVPARLEFLRSGREIHDRGIYLELKAFQYHVFLDFREVADTPAGDYRQLAQELGGRGVADVGEALRELRVRPVAGALRALFSDGLLSALALFAAAGSEGGSSRAGGAAAPAPAPAGARDETITLELLSGRFTDLLLAARSVLQIRQPETGTLARLSHRFRRDIEGIRRLSMAGSSSARAPAAAPRTSRRGIRGRPPQEAPDTPQDLAMFFPPAVAEPPPRRETAMLLGWASLSALAAVAGEEAVDTLGVWNVLGQILDRFGEGRRDAQLVRLLVLLPDAVAPGAGEPPLLAASALERPDVREFLGVNTYGGTEYYNKESLELLVRWKATIAAIRRLDGGRRTSGKGGGQFLRAIIEEVQSIRKASDEAGYRIGELRKRLLPLVAAARAGGGAGRAGAQRQRGRRVPL